MISPSVGARLASRAGEVNTTLVQAGLVVTELRPNERSLEDIFLELTHEVAA